VTTKAKISWTSVKVQAGFKARPKCSRTGDSTHLVPCGQCDSSNVSVIQ